MKPTAGPQKPKETSGPLPHTDFDGAFTTGAVFLRGDKECTMETAKWGTLNVPSGRIVANDVIAGLSRAKPLKRVVPPGKYPVTIAWNGDATCAMKVRFSGRKAVRWEPAIRVGEKLGAGSNSNPPCFGVDTGMAGFFDADAARMAGKSESWDAQFDTSRRSIKIDPVSGAGLVWCFSGYGDGCYPCYWGLDRDDNVACLVADFLVLVENVYDEHVITDLHAKVGPDEFVDPWLVQIGCTGVRLEWSKKKNEFHFEYQGDKDLKMELLNGKGKWAGRGGVSSTRYLTRVFNVHTDKKATLQIKMFVGMRALSRKS